MPDHRYKKSLLAEVIFQLDFSAPITSLARELPLELNAGALARFKIPEPQETKTINWSVSGDGKPAVQTEERGTLWQFHGQSREKLLKIAPAFVNITTRSYTSFEDFRDDVCDIVALVTDSFPEARASRLGLRYVNILRLEEQNPLSWDAYITEPFRGGNEVAQAGQSLARVWHTVVLADDNQLVTCQYGMHNPDYPAPIVKKHFVLDFDAARAGHSELGDVHGFLASAHASIQRLFEAAITDALREKMGRV